MLKNAFDLPFMLKPATKSMLTWNPPVLTLRTGRLLNPGRRSSKRQLQFKTVGEE